MQQRHWREMVEIIGILGIVASLLLLAWQVRESNNIARAGLEYQLASSVNEIYEQHATDPEFAKLYAKMEHPEKHLVTTTEDSQMRGLALQLTSVFWSAQVAFDNGVFDRGRLIDHKGKVSWTLENQPALQEHFIYLYETVPAYDGKEIFEPIAALITARELESAD